MIGSMNSGMSINGTSTLNAPLSPMMSPINTATQSVGHRHQVVSQPVMSQAMHHQVVHQPVQHHAVQHVQAVQPVQPMVMQPVQQPVQVIQAPPKVETKIEYRDKIVEVEVEKVVPKYIEVPYERVVTKEVPVEVEKIVYQDRPYPVEKIVEVEKIVTKEVPVEVERIVTKEVPVEVEKIVYVDKVVEVEKIVEKPVEVIKYVEVPVVEKHEVRVPVPVQTNSWEQVTRGSVQLPVNYQARSIGLNDRVSGYSEQTVTMPRSPNRSSVVYNGSAPPLYTDGGSVLRNNDFYTTMSLANRAGTVAYSSPNYGPSYGASSYSPTMAQSPTSELYHDSRYWPSAYASERLSPGNATERISSLSSLTPTVTATRN
jgi:hypothetical protein